MKQKIRLMMVFSILILNTFTTLFLFGNQLSVDECSTGKYKIYNKDNPAVDMEFYRQMELLNTSGLEIRECDDYLQFEESFGLNEESRRAILMHMHPEQEREYLLSKLHNSWNLLIEHCNEAIYYAEEIENQRVMDQVSDCVKTTMAALLATKDIKSAIVAGAIEFIAQFSISNCYYFGQVKYHMWRAETWAKEWDAIFIYMKEKNYL